MARAYSVDLRRRVIDAIEGGLSTREAARRFAIGIATAGAWHRLWRRTGDVRPGRQGNPGGSKLDAHEGYILGLVEAHKDISLAEITARLTTERGVKTCPATVCIFLRKRGWTFKKRQRTPPSKTGRTSRPHAKPGSTVRSISTPAG